MGCTSVGGLEATARQRGANKHHTATIFQSKSFIDESEKTSKDAHQSAHNKQNHLEFFKNISKKDVKECISYINERKNRREKISEISSIDSTFFKYIL